MAPIGCISASVQVANPKVWGTRGKVAGIITLKYAPATHVKGGPVSSEQELFGPLRLSVVLTGQARLKVLENRTSHAYIMFSETRRLFRKSDVVYDGPLRASATSPAMFPFEVAFPEHTDSFRGLRSRLPPNFYVRFQCDAYKQAGKHQGAAWLDYGLTVAVEMPGIQIDTKMPPEIALRYEQSALRWNMSRPGRQFEQNHSIATNQLLPDSERPNGLLDKTVAAIKNNPKPTYAFKASCVSIAEAVHVGATTSFVIRIQPDAQVTAPATADGEAPQPSSEPVPDIRLHSCDVDLLARTQIYATNKDGMDSPKLVSVMPIAKLQIARQDPDQGPFTKASDYTKTLTTCPVPGHIPPSFCIAKLERSYLLRFSLRFVVARQVVVMRKEFPIMVLARENAPVQRPGLAYASSSSVGASGSYARRAPVDEYYDEEEALPVYEAGAAMPPPLVA